MFSLGQVVATTGVHSIMLQIEDFSCFIMNSLDRHQTLDFGDLCKDDLEANGKLTCR